MKKLILALLALTAGLQIANAGHGSEYVGHIYKGDYDSEAVNFSLGHVTRHNSYSTVVFDVDVSERYAPIVNTIKVDGRATTVGRRLSHGLNYVSVRIPRGARTLRVSFDHGRGSDVEVYVE